eukprot:CAMPEP_0118946046 /NCGR_PEP_ID=MMETSP1169-20130426/43483_1 /TAXON_ID=36882 /ORGANISM="Pyramimonas obovata, Strain CCMP722" /LENGTH=176 /DNA_ID=CAMNT_0006891925 /DNA_START=230 /DNA_END=760 /DNA_ORIENTATION=+
MDNVEAKVLSAHGERLVHHHSQAAAPRPILTLLELLWRECDIVEHSPHRCLEGNLRHAREHRRQPADVDTMDGAGTRGEGFPILAAVGGGPSSQPGEEVPAMAVHGQCVLCLAVRRSFRDFLDELLHNPHREPISEVIAIAIPWKGANDLEAGGEPSVGVPDRNHICVFDGRQRVR